MAIWSTPRRRLVVSTFRKTYSTTKKQEELMAKGLPKKRKLPGVTNTVLVASGKGGVGKSTTAVNLAVSLANDHGLKVGLLDADVYGPSVPLMMNLANEEPPLTDPDDGSMMLPPTSYGVKCMSMGFLVRKSSSALVWRGPMVMAALQKLAFSTRWHPLDVLVVDMPPGTGDVHLSVAQTIDVSGAVVVSTPQKVALIDARKAVSMFDVVKIPLVGLVENMGTFGCPKCGQATRIFGGEDGGVKELSRDLGVPLLGDVPLDPDVMKASDRGTPIVISAPESTSARGYSDIAKNVVTFLSSPT